MTFLLKCPLELSKKKKKKKERESWRMRAAPISAGSLERSWIRETKQIKEGDGDKDNVWRRKKRKKEEEKRMDKMKVEKGEII